MAYEVHLEGTSSLIKTLQPLMITVMLASAVAVSPRATLAQTERSGKEVVDAVCAACHRTGVNDAPKIGDKKAWAKRASQGLTGLTEHALKGIREMPAHGGNPNLTDLEIARAVTFMVNQSGGRWVEPVSVKELATLRTGEQVVQARCIKCHETGAGGAPKIGDQAAWAPRLKNGLDNTVRSATRGHGGMPARGGMADLTDSELRSAIVYMFSKGAVPAQ
jgi:cytochrome c5